LPNGRFAPGHKSAKGRGWKRAIRELAGPNFTDPELKGLAGDAGSLYRARLAELPHVGPTVSAIVAEGARSSVLSARFAARALELGLDTQEGQRALEMSMRLGQRAERTSVSALDLATRLAESERKKPQAWPWLVTDAEPAPRHDHDAAASSSTSKTTETRSAPAGRVGAAIDTGTNQEANE
jgi:hypothetical protein